MKLTVVIVNYNVKHYAEQCLHSVMRATKGIDAHVCVVDNHSKDGSVDYLQGRFPDVEIIDSNHNLGFARANNIAIAQTESDYVLLLNPDTFVAENTLRDTLAFMDAHPKAGGVGVAMHNTDGSLAQESRRGLPTPLTSLCKMTGLCAHFPKSRTFGRYYMGYLPWDSPQRIEVISGAYCMLRRKAIEQVGSLDEDYFMYGEDIDLSYRLLKGGWENWYLPLHILHYKGESTQKSSFRYVHVFYQAMLIFFRKHYGHLSFCITLPIKLAIYAKASIALVKMLIDRMRRSLGFMKRNRPDHDYLFIGTPSTLASVRKLARRKGLRSTFVVSDGQQTHGVDEALDAMGTGGIIAVFDVAAFGYGDILRHISAMRPGVQLGTYNPHTRIIITPYEIIK